MDSITTDEMQDTATTTTPKHRSNDDDDNAATATASQPVAAQLWSKQLNGVSLSRESMTASILFLRLELTHSVVVGATISTIRRILK